MSAINDNVYARVREKGKEKNLSEQELKAVDTAREQLQTHSKVTMDLVQLYILLKTFLRSLHGWFHWCYYRFFLG